MIYRDLTVRIPAEVVKELDDAIKNKPEFKLMKPASIVRYILEKGITAEKENLVEEKPRESPLSQASVSQKAKPLSLLSQDTLPSGILYACWHVDPEIEAQIPVSWSTTSVGIK